MENVVEKKERKKREPWTIEQKEKFKLMIASKKASGKVWGRPKSVKPSVKEVVEAHVPNA